MKFSNLEKIIIGLVTLSAIFAIYTTYTQIINLQRVKKLNSISYTTIEEKKLPDNIKKLSHQYKAFEEIYNSDKPILVYGIDTKTWNKKFGTYFQDDLNKELEGKKIAYEIIAYPDWEKEKRDLEIANSNENEVNSCSPESTERKELDIVTKHASDCFMNACIIDVKNNKYFKISRDITYITKILTKEIPLK